MSHEFYVENYRITQGLSVFTKRNNATDKLHDITIWKTDPSYNWGLWIDGKYYQSVVTLACEDGHQIRGHAERVPGWILERLEQWGFTLKGFTKEYIEE